MTKSALYDRDPAMAEECARCHHPQAFHEGLPASACVHYYRGARCDCGGYVSKRDLPENVLARLTAACDDPEQAQRVLEDHLRRKAPTATKAGRPPSKRTRPALTEGV